MQNLIVAALLVLLGSGLPVAEAHSPRTAQAITSNFFESKQAVKNALIEVVQSQLAAFRAGNFTKAYSYASADIQKQMQPAAFEQMVRDSYPVIAQSKSAKFGAVLDNGVQAVVHVSLVGTRQATFAYLMTREGRAWKISGVIEGKPPEREGEMAT